jgi:cell division septum initiation protein DivIVA
MQYYDYSSEIAKVEQLIATLSSQLMEAQSIVQEWTETNANLSHSAAEARAKNQGMGRGFLGGLLGSKYRGAMRSAAAASNAAIAKEIVEKRAKIAEGKREAQELVKNLKEQLSFAKQELKTLKSKARSQSHIKSTKTKSASTSLDLLQKLKEAQQAGLLTDAEYEEKRKKLVSEL